MPSSLGINVIRMPSLTCICINKENDGSIVSQLGQNLSKLLLFLSGTFRYAINLVIIITRVNQLYTLSVYNSRIMKGQSPQHNRVSVDKGQCMIIQLKCNSVQLLGSTRSFLWHTANVDMIAGIEVHH